MELVLGIALGSASQVALLVLPGMVLLEARSARGARGCTTIRATERSRPHLRAYRR